MGLKWAIGKQSWCWEIGMKVKFRDILRMSIGQGEDAETLACCCSKEIYKLLEENKHFS